MTNILPTALLLENNFRNGFLTAKYLLNLPWLGNIPKVKQSFSTRNILCQLGQSHEPRRQLPTLIYIQNPITWLINKIDFKMLKSAWDIEFDEEEFRRGTKQAVAVICTLISQNLWDNLRGLVARQALIRLQRDVEINWSDIQRRNIDMVAHDVKLALPRKVHFLKIGDQKFVDIDMMCIGMKFKEKEPSLRTDLIFIEILARFHRNYTAGELPNWTVTLFKVTRFTTKSGRQ